MSKAKTISYDHRMLIFFALIGVAVLSLVTYIYAINATARNIAQIERVEDQMSGISAKLSALEFAYVEKKNNVSMELAYEYGFKEVQNPTYVSRNPRTSLTLNTSR